MARAQDRAFDAAMDRLIGPGGRLETAGGPGAAVPVALPATLPGLRRHFCALHRDRTALVAGDERIDFATLDALAERTATALVGMGVRPGDRVGIAMRNCPAWIVLHLATVAAGGIATLLNGWWESDELARALGLTGPMLVLADAERAQRIAAAGWRGSVTTLPIERPAEEALAPILAAPPGRLPEVAPGDDATILFTSGSNDRPRGAVSTHRAVTAATYDFLAHSLATRAMLEARGEAPAYPPATLIGVPLFHVTGAIALFLNSVALGRKMVLMPRWNAGEALRLIEAERVTYFSGVPTMGYEMMRHPDAGKRDLSSLADLVAGGAARPVAHVAPLRAAFPATHPMAGYGLTETNATGCTNMRASYLGRPASVGRAQRPFVAVAIRGADGATLPDGEAGEVVIRGAGLMRGYWRDEDATAAAFSADGWLRTGDLGHLDAEGYLFLTGRAKDVVNRGGEMISAAEVEAALTTHPSVAEAAVFPLADERLGEVPGAVVRLAPGGTVDIDALAVFAGARLARFKRPARLWLAEEDFPRLGSGKVDKRALLRRFAAQVLE